nr:PREDICTED: embryonic protein UVS.2-like [Latimeria chalumnae]|eukprot:XP_014347719.1 PREDICTED: embryonic protein UVS.2-like [Latimeria chalumnae]
MGQFDGFTNKDYLKIKGLFNCSSICSSVFHEWTGSFTSANYPSPYPANSDCIFFIRTPRQRIRLKFHKFKLQSSKNCSKDYIKVYDGDTNASRLLLDKTCGKLQIPTLIASTNILLIYFITDNTINKYGFVASYKTGICGDTLTNMTGEFKSPNYPRYYPSNSDCYWTIVAPKEYMISLEMEDFKLEFSFGCEVDYVSIRDGGDDKYSVVGQYCGTEAMPTFNSTRNSIMVHLRTDDSRSNKGFLATYTMYYVGNSASELHTFRLLTNGYVNPWTFLCCIIMDLTLQYTDSMISFFG